jgi:hypothetical protein
MRTFAIFAAIVLASPIALAQDADAQARARTLFTEGLAFADYGDWQRAAHRFRAALEAHPTDNIRFNLAQSLVHLGRLVEAIEELERLDEPNVESELRQAAGHLHAQVAPRLGRLIVEVRGDAGGSQVMIDNRPLERLNEPVAADPGVRIARLVRGISTLDLEEVDIPSGRETRVVLEVPTNAPASTSALGGSDDAWIWGVVLGVIAVAAGAGIAIGVAVAGEGSSSGGDFGPPVLEFD